MLCFSDFLADLHFSRVTLANWIYSLLYELFRFYYNRRTALSTWEKPLELMTPMEVSHATNLLFLVSFFKFLVISIDSFHFREIVRLSVCFLSVLVLFLLGLIFQVTCEWNVFHFCTLNAIFYEVWWNFSSLLEFLSSRHPRFCNFIARLPMSRAWLDH